MLMKSNGWKIGLVALVATAAAWGGTFGTVVSIGGEAADLALDQTRGVLYIANFTAKRIDVMSLANHTIQTSINVGAQPSSIALSPDAHYLVATNFGNTAAPA
jgi:DNA-binding beta-propeller fold protein YncE